MPKYSTSSTTDYKSLVLCGKDHNLSFRESRNTVPDRDIHEIDRHAIHVSETTEVAVRSPKTLSDYRTSVLAGLLLPKLAAKPKLTDTFCLYSIFGIVRLRGQRWGRGVSTSSKVGRRGWPAPIVLASSPTTYGYRRRPADERQAGRGSHVIETVELSSRPGSRDRQDILVFIGVEKGNTGPDDLTECSSSSKTC
ncbi:hypothetical protein LX36DRAFT_671487 [Colletotrichum falcatum]|nr:hypothetical protein LX36DRAFT_671487 [Colletotrichum falcatum]